MPRSTRNSNASKTSKSSGCNSRSTRRSSRAPAATPVDEQEEKPESTRKSLRTSSNAASSSSVAKASPTPSAASSTSTRSRRKRAPATPEGSEVEVVIDNQPTTVPHTPTSKRRRVAAAEVTPQPPSSEKPTKSTRGRGKVSKKEPTPSPTPPPSSRAKNATTSVQESPQSSPLPPSSSRRRKRPRNGGGSGGGGGGTTAAAAAAAATTTITISSGEEDAVGEEEALATTTPVKKRAAKRSKRASRKSDTPQKATTAVIASIESPKTPPAEEVVETKTKKKTPTKAKPPQQPQEPVKSLTVSERMAIERRELLQRLDHYDLSDRATVASLLAAWPEQELRSPPSHQETVIGAAERLWVSVNDSLQQRVNGDGRKSIEEDAEAAPPSAKRARHASPPPPPPPHPPTQEGGVSATQMTESGEGTERGSVVDTFCVASFTLTLGESGKVKAKEKEECAHLLREVAAISPDVFCLKGAAVDLVNSCLYPELNRQGYVRSGPPVVVEQLCSSSSSSPSSSSSSTLTSSFIFYNAEVFQEVAFQSRSVQSVAQSLVERCAYPQAWREVLTQSLTEVAVGGGEEPSLQVAVLRHRATGSAVLFACLSELSTSSSSSSSSSPSSTTPTTAANVEQESEWKPPCGQARPDLAAIRAAGCVWALEDVWQDVCHSSPPSSTSAVAALMADPETSNSFLPPLLLNGNNNSSSSSSNGGTQKSSTTSTRNRWVLCANLEASPSSPAYQILRDGYPAEETIIRLQAMRNVHLEQAAEEETGKTEPRSLLHMLWHAFQHTSTGVRSCYQAVLGTEPPFTRIVYKESASALPRKCVDYIFCSGGGLAPQQVLLPPCRSSLLAAATAAVPQGRGRRGAEAGAAAIDSRVCSAAPFDEVGGGGCRTVAFSLASKIRIV